MNRYDSYVNTGSDWVPEIPEHWSLTRSKFIFRNKSVKNCLNEPLLSVTQKDGVVLRSESNLNVWNPTEDVSGYKLIEPSNFVISLRSFEGGLELSTVKGIVSPAYTVLEKTRKIDDPYFRWLMKSHQFIIELNKHVTGIRQGKNIGWDDFSNIYLTVPPIEEQKLISRYLDKKTSQIDSLVEKIQKKIDLLKEQRTSLINHYVTKGLDPNVEMKNSSVEWFGEIPKHWKISKLKFEMEIHNNKRIPLSAEERGQRQGPYPYYGSTSLIDHVDDYLFDGQYILIAEDGANLVMRNLRLSFIVDGKFWVNNHAHILKSKDHSFDEYYCELLEQTDFTTVITGSTQPKLTLEAIKDIPLCVPPKHEMDQITGKIQTVLSDFNNLIELTNKKRKLLVEYRQSLISSVVTGKVRVMEDMI